MGSRAKSMAREISFGENAKKIASIIGLVVIVMLFLTPTGILPDPRMPPDLCTLPVCFVLLLFVFII